MTQRLLPLTGVAFFALFVIGYVVGTGGSPDDTASGPAVVSYYVGHQSQVHMALFLLAIAAVPLMFFVGSLHAVLRAAGDGSRPLAAVVLAGGAIWGTGLFVMAMTHDAILQAALHGQVGVVSTLNVLSNNDFFPVVGGIAIQFLAVGITSARGVGLPAWLGWIAILIGVLALAGPLGQAAFLGAPLWVLVVSIMVATRGIAVGVGSVAPAQA